MGYHTALDILESRKIGTDYNGAHDKVHFFTRIEGVGEVRLLVETKPGKLEEEFDVMSPEETISVIQSYADAPMYVLLDDLEPLDCQEPPYGNDDPEGSMSLTDMDIEEDYRDRVSQIKSYHIGGCI